MSRIPSLSMLQMMKAVAFAGVAFACVAPLLRTWQAGAVNGGARSGLIAIAIFGAVAVPVAWTGLAVMLIRPGTWRDGLITFFLLCSASVALAFASWTLVAFSIPVLWSRPEWTFIASAILNLLIVGVLGAACAFLSRRLWRSYHPVVGAPVAQS